MHFKLLVRLTLVSVFACAFSIIAQAQNKTVSGKIVDSKDGSALVGVSVVAKGTTVGTQTGADGTFRLSVPNNVNTLVVSSVGFTSQDVAISSSGTANVSLVSSSDQLGEVVVVGYGTARKRDLTGSVASVQAKDFNKGIITSPDQLIQGKVPGVQILNNSGQPGGDATIRIRGNASVRSGNNPLFVVDGVPLDGRSARPGYGANFGSTVGQNPLNFINPNDIASIDVLKDASATAIYGARGANGVVLITTKRGQSGVAKVDASAVVGVSNILRKYDVLNADEYKAAASSYSLTGTTFGANVDAMDAILRTGVTQNYNATMSGGNETGRYRVSLGYINQEGIIKGSDFERISANINGQYKFLENKRLSLDFNILTSQQKDAGVPISTDAGFEGSLISQALVWNPTRALYAADGSLVPQDLTSNAINPLFTLEQYNDHSKLTSILASVAPGYKITDNLEYKLLLSVNYSTGNRRASLSSLYPVNGILGRGQGFIGNSELLTSMASNTLNYTKKFGSSLNMTALLGYEYQRFDNSGYGMNAQDFGTNALDYTNIFGNSSQSTRGVYSYADPISELQSFFGRVTLNYNDKYLLTATMRADGSSKFGANNKYGYFPSLAAAWNITNEDFMKGNNTFGNLKLRLGYGETGNQEFPAGSAQERFSLGINGPGTLGQTNVANPDLQWETSSTYNAGVDFSLFNDRLTGSIEYFNKKTSNLLFNFDAIQPAPATKYWINLDGEVVNKGWEIALNTAIMNKRDMRWNLGVFASFLQNEVTRYTGPTVLTGALHGQGTTGASVQRLTQGQPLNAFYVREFLGLDKATGNSTYTNNGNTMYYIGNPNPSSLLGISTDFSYKKFTFTLNMNGAFGHKIYNNTLMSVLPISNLQGGRNIASSLIGGEVKESLSNGLTSSSRFLEDGSYLKLANATLNYSIGNIGKAIRGANVFITGQNLFIITKFKGFDPEVNTDKNIAGVPSFGIEYTPYPSARSFMLGINFSL
jgi:TonB-linked SusC/RagA family outer membrane protein